MSGDYWRNNRALHHLTPRGERWPEVGLESTLKDLCVEPVMELGCGDGRLAGFFSAEGYVGFDINPHAVAAARNAHPEHTFTTEGLRPGHTLLAHTVLLHIPDDEIEEMMAELALYPRVVIGEMMGRHWRRPGDPPVFNRDPEEYVAMLGREMVLHRVPYPRYDEDLIVLAG